MEVQYCLKKFDQLSSLELCDIYRLRQEVFVVEQNCPYVDVDGLDKDSIHLCGYAYNALIAYSRLIPPGYSYEDSSAIGRVITSQKIRGKGIGKDLMHRSIELSKALWPGISIKISAQTYLKSFYESFNFKQLGGEYMEDGIPHIHMTLDYNS